NLVQEHDEGQLKHAPRSAGDDENAKDHQKEDMQLELDTAEGANGPHRRPLTAGGPHGQLRLQRRLLPAPRLRRTSPERAPAKRDLRGYTEPSSGTGCILRS